MHPDVKLMLGRDLIKASAAGIAFNLNNCKAIPGNLADPSIGHQQTVFNELPVILRIFNQVALLFFGFRDDIFEFVAFYFKVVLPIL